jgi:O-antigen/teichoic acid export membrane protein
MTSTRRNLVENVFSLSTLQIANYIVPLIVLPYLVRVLGPGYYGEVVFSQAFIQFLVLFTDYGFSHNGPREVALLRDDIQGLRRLFTETLVVKMLLLLFAGIVLILLCLFVPPFSLYPSLHLFTYGIVLSEVLACQFFYQGLERMRYLAVIGIITRIVIVVGIFLCITEQSDFLYVTLVYSSCYVTGGMISFLIGLKTIGWKLHAVKRVDLVSRIRANFKFFVTSTSISAGTAGNTVILRFFASPEIVGIYGAAEKIIIAGIGMANPVLQTLLPYITRLVRESQKAAIRRIQQAVALAFLAGLLSFLAAIFFGDSLVAVLLGDSFRESIPIFLMLSALPAGYWVTMVYGNLYFIGFGHYNSWSRIFTGISIGGIVLALLFVGGLGLGGSGMATALLLRAYIGLAVVYVMFRKSAAHSNAIST